jgi:hypothetical protein
VRYNPNKRLIAITGINARAAALPEIVKDRAPDHNYPFRGNFYYLTLFESKSVLFGRTYAPLNTIMHAVLKTRALYDSSCENQD